MKKHRPNRNSLELVDIENIANHSLLDQLPGIWDDDSAEMQALVADIAERGIDEPLFVVQPSEHIIQYLLADGRHRLRAAQLAGLLTVPVIFREESEVADIILGTLIHRRHCLSKGILAYVSYPAVAEKLKACTHGGARPGSGKPRKISSPDDPDLKSYRDGEGEKGSKAPKIVTMDSIATSLGISAELLGFAKAIYVEFQRTPSLRAVWEPKILSGQVGINRVMPGIIGAEETKGKPRGLTDYLGQTPEGKIKGLMPRSLTTLRNGFATWEEIDGEARYEFAREFIALLDELPDEIVSLLKSRRA
jgi:hypothetical protein